MDPRNLSKRLAAIIDTAIDGIITIDDKGIVESINIAACDLFGYKASDVIGQNVSILMPEPDYSRHDGYLRRYKETKERRIIGIGRDVKGRKKSGEVFPMRLAVGEVILNDRIIFTGIIHDLSDLDSALRAIESANQQLELKVEQRTTELEDTVNRLLSTNQQLEESRRRLEESLEKEKELSELKSRFVSMASHEFRTPLSTILSSASIISRYTEELQQNKRTKHVDRIKSAVNNLTGILNDFLSISKLEEGAIGVKFESILVLPLLEEVKSELEGLLKSGQTIHIKSKKEVVRLETDRRILKNVLFNLTSNAIKYSQEETVIVCEVYQTTETVSIDVKDEGIGIPISEQKHLFTRFFRATNVENIQGTGLGLAIVVEYISLLKGTIAFESVEGEGSTFSITIPTK